ncbi:MAG: right-handed parallel beta-helix repeat-containing protein [Ilumatobacteraceae bacterium]
MGGRVKFAVAAMLSLVLIGAVLPPSPAAHAGLTEELDRPPGLDPDWPACIRNAPYGLDSIGCAVNDVPGNRADYVFLHGRAYFNDGRTIDNLGYTSPFGQGETVGYVSIGDHTGLSLAPLHSDHGGWWGVWVPIKQNDDPTPPVRAWIAPMRSYPSTYNWVDHTPPSPPPFGAESDAIGLGSGDRAVRVDDLYLPGPTESMSPCEQVAYTEAGGLIRCSASPRPTHYPVTQEYTWTWFDGETSTGPAVERLFPQDGTYQLYLEGHSDDGWTVRSHQPVLVSECRATHCLEATQNPDDYGDHAPNTPIPVSLDVTNVGQVALTDVRVTVFNIPAGLTVTTPPAPVASLAVGATTTVALEVTASEPGGHQFDFAIDATLPSGRNTSRSTSGYVLVGGGDLQVTIDAPDRVGVGESVSGAFVVTNHSDTTEFTDVNVWANTDSTLILGLDVADDFRTLSPGASTRFDFTMHGVSVGSTALHVEAAGGHDDTYDLDRENLDVTVGGEVGLVVNQTDDRDDPDLGDQRCDVDPDTDGDQCTLRGAIDEANAAPGANTITFDVDGPIQIDAPLPFVLDELTIDGASTVELHATSSFDGLSVFAGPTAIRGLTFVGFDRALVLAAGDGTVADSTFRENRIGVDAQTATTITGSTFVGVGDTPPSGDSAAALVASGPAGVTIARASGPVSVSGSSFSQLTTGVAAVPDDDLTSLTVTGGNFDHVQLGVFAHAAPGRAIGSVSVGGVQAFTNTSIAVAVGGAIGPIDVHDNVMSGAAVGVVAAETFEGLQITGNRMSQCSLCVLGLANDRFTITGNTLAGGGFGVLAADDAPTTGEISNNTIDSPIGILSAGQDHMVITGNRMTSSSTKIGVLVGSSRDLTLTGNTIDNAQAIGVLLAHVTQSNVAGNTITDGGVAMFGVGREPTPEELAAFNADGATADELWSRANSGGAVGYANALATTADLDATSFYRGATFFERVDITDNTLTGNDLGLLLGGGPRGVLVSGNQISNNAWGGVILGAAPGEAGPQSVEIRRNTMTGNGTQQPDGLFAPIPGILLFSNSGLAYDYSSAKPHPNDPGDGDAGPNGMQNFPIITSVVSTSDRSTVQGVLDSTPNTTFVVDIYANASCHASTYGEGATWLTAVDVATNSSGHGTFQVVVPRQALNNPVTATASAPTPVRLSTSEFSPCAYPAIGVTTSASTGAGATEIPVTSNDGFSIGDIVQIGGGTPSAETARIVGFGSLILDRPLRFDHPVGTEIVVLPSDTDLAPVCPGAELETDVGRQITATLRCDDESSPTYAFVGSPPPGFTLTSAGALTYLPPPGVTGAVSATYVATDAGGQESAPATITVTVHAVVTPSMRLVVQSAVFVTGPRVPAAFAIGGTFVPAAGSSVACGNEVTLSLGSVWSQTISGRRFTRLLGQCIYVRRSSSEGLLVSIVFDPRRGTWAAIGLGPRGALAGLSSPVDIGLRIGDDEGSATVRIGRS